MRKNIVRAGISAALVLTVYLLMVFFVPKYYRSTDQAQTNRLKCESYVEDGGNYEVVCVGSSEMNRIKVSDIDSGWYNLALSGKNSLTGLDLITKLDYKPRIVLIEINDTIIRAPDDDLVENAMHSNVFTRIKYRPDYLLFSLYRNIIDGYISELEGRSVNETLIQKKIDEFQEKCEEESLNDALMQIFQYVQILKKNGTQVYFVETPNDYRLYDSERMKDVRFRAQEMFSPEEYGWITCDWSEYQTQDGIHLCYEDAARFAQFLYHSVQRNQ